MLGAVHKSPEAFRTISEVAAELDVPQHVLRFWETKFAMLRPLKRGGGRRYYRPDDVDLLRGIRSLLYSDGLTIKGVQKILREQGPRYVMDLGRGAASHLAGQAMVLGAAASGRAASGAGRANLEQRLAALSNVHLFPRDSERDTHADAARGGARPDMGRRARLTALLSELLTLKARLRAARAPD